MNAVTYLVTHERIPYRCALDAVGGVRGRDLENADLSVPFRALKHWMKQYGDDDDAINEIGNVFHQDHLLLIARIIGMVYPQEHKMNDELHGNSAFLSLKSIFGEDPRRSTHDLYDFMMFAKSVLDDNHRNQYRDLTNLDDNSERLYSFGDGFHMLPLHRDGAPQIPSNDGNTDDDDDWAYRTPQKVDPFPHNTMVYLRGGTIVEATVSGYEMITEERRISSEFWSKFGHIDMNFDYSAEQHDKEGVEALVIDANNGNKYAAAFLLSKALQGRVVTDESIFPCNYPGYEQVETPLKMGVITQFVGNPFITCYGEEIVLPVLGFEDGAKMGVLEKNEDEDSYLLEWRDAPDDVRFLSYPNPVDDDARLVCE